MAVVFDTKSPLNALVTLVDGLAVTLAVYKGVPEAVDRRVVAIVTVGGQDLRMKATELLERWATYVVEFAYRLDGDEAAGEDALADFLDQFIAAHYADVTLGGTAIETAIDFGLVDDPTYQPRAGQEFRVFPVRVRVKQRSNRQV